MRCNNKNAKMVFSTYDKKRNILSTQFEAEVDKEEIVNYINITKRNKEYPRELKIITDSRKSKMIITEEDIPEIVNANNKSLKEYKFIVDAIVIENSQDAQYSLFYKELSKADNYYFHVFADYDKALKWLLEFQP